ncbi:DNA-binding transcriptional LysR family regulator [Pseudonocardia sediminis]|uniref:DNA-binding transcriptional LysR family regulator n=1 Tax=Pseudonocardia sediminis TaxID=1397368 RepID=A0A4Q7UWX5_PSEST|nr:LysR family transcriptional regulator [Pseudonocardia sediminis]RZT86482.1 DNA-binding transcriptional LysR family regulator [Pseudonocardia sediminis]
MALSPHVPDLTSLELLVTVARVGSLGAAGREFGMTQQAVSARMRSTEKLVGVRLLRRDVRGTTLTDEGAMLVDWARGVLAAADELDAAITAVRGDRDGRLDVAASFTVAEFLLPAWLARLRAELGPGTGVNLVVRNSEQVAAMVLAGEADVGFVEGPTLPDGLDTVTVGTDQLVLVVAPDHRWARRRNGVGAAELAATALVTRERGSGTRLVLERALDVAAPGVARAKPSLELSATTAIRQAVLAGAGPAVLSAVAVTDDVDTGRLVRVRIDGGMDLRRELRGVWPEGPAPAGPARDLLRIARARSPRPRPGRTGSRGTAP